MQPDRVHRTLSDDGTEIAGRVLGQGPPLVLVHGSLEDGDLLWGPLVRFLGERFSCYLMSTRGRGLSAAHPDLSPERLVEDVTSFADSIGEPVGLVGESAGGMLALGAAARTNAVSAVAVHEPVVLEALSEEDAAGLQESFAEVQKVAAEGRLADAARIFVEPLVNGDEQAAVSASDYFENTGRYVPLLLQELEHAIEPEGYSPTDPSVLARITVPVLLLHGSRTAMRTWFKEGVRHVADHVAAPRIGEIEGAGHWGPVLEPEPIADALSRFFAEAHDPTPSVANT